MAADVLVPPFLDFFMACGLRASLSPYENNVPSWCLVSKSSTAITCITFINYFRLDSGSLRSGLRHFISRIVCLLLHISFFPFRCTLHLGYSLEICSFHPLSLCLRLRLFSFCFFDFLLASTLGRSVDHTWMSVGVQGSSNTIGHVAFKLGAGEGGKSRMPVMGEGTVMEATIFFG